MHHNFIKLFSLKKCPQIAMSGFDMFLKNKVVKKLYLPHRIWLL
ncbi:hypothetical protein RVIR1_04710 [Candidatus Rickettsiella viridis]|uniref:Uncharacterized protein n=1 Tax=Candidatus Rickettsiella viridis TaxID=676208 RepID=A0A2Z5V3F0_9COXI|nr:hypothetical protein RVIR1_04710 [Candidatus Rickettsiella viridis]